MSGSALGGVSTASVFISFGCSFLGMIHGSKHIHSSQSLRFPAAMCLALGLACLLTPMGMPAFGS